MEKILYSKFENVGDLLDRFKKSFKPKEKSKVTTLFLTWKEIVGDKMAGMSKPVGLSKNKTLIVVCKNSLITQELYLTKARILKAVQFYAESLNLKVNDVCFSHKDWGKYNKEEAD